MPLRTAADPGGIRFVDITVSARHIEVSPALRAAAEEKIGRLGRFLDEILRAEVHFSEERNPRINANEVCEVSMEGGGHHVRCKAAAADPFAAIDLAVEKLEQQLHKLKSKQDLRAHQGLRRASVPDATQDESGD
jgi:ribosomal subunit interface protein